MPTSGDDLPGNGPGPRPNPGSWPTGSPGRQIRVPWAPAGGFQGVPEQAQAVGEVATLVHPWPTEDAEDRPRPTAGLELQGEYRDSGFTTPRYLVRRGDGQVIQLTRLLYLVASAADGTRSCEDIAHRVSGPFGQTLAAEDIAYLVERKLRPLGVVAPSGPHPEEAPAPKTDLLLTLKAHKVLLKPPRVNVIASALSWLHRPVVVGLVLAAVLAADGWLFAVHGAMPPVLHTLEQPVLLLLVFALTVGSTGFHELGHASGCRYGGARPGCIGCGIYLVWPAMYTDVTDVYRLNRAGRLRTDLGGVYFNVVFMLALFGGYAATRQEFLLAAVYLIHFEVLEQLMPALRLDGYYILGDLAGVPDLFGKVKPILQSMIPGRPAPPSVSGLKRSSRLIVTAWVLSMVPLILGEIAYALWNLPRLLSTSLRSLTEQIAGTGQAVAGGDLASALLGVIGSVMLILPTAGLAYLLLRIAGRLVRAAGRARGLGLRSRLVLLVAVGGVAVILLEAWSHGVTPGPLPARPPVAPALQPNVLTPAPSATPTPGIEIARPGGPATHVPAPATQSATRSSAATTSPAARAPAPPSAPASPSPSSAPPVIRPSSAPPTGSTSPSPSATPSPSPSPTPPSPTPSASAT